MVEIVNLDKVIISFISAEPYYTAEKLGYKNNTVREIDFTDDRFRKLAMMYETGEYGKIEIQNTKFAVGNDSFTRQIQHIAFWKNLAIITWKHEAIE